MTPKPQDTAWPRHTLRAVLELIIPASRDGRMPSVAEYDVAGYARRRGPADLAAIAAELERLETQAQQAFGSAFHALDADRRRAITDELRAREPAFLAQLARLAAMCYYEQDEVLSALGLDARPPFPLGHHLEPGDLSLLDPVRKRAPLYRKVE